MLFNVAVQFEGAYLLIIASGSAALPELCALADFGATVASLRGCNRALFDMLALRNQMTREERYQLNNHIAASLSNLARVAAVLLRISVPTGHPVRPELDAWIGLTWTVLRQRGHLPRVSPRARLLWVA